MVLAYQRQAGHLAEGRTRTRLCTWRGTDPPSYETTNPKVNNGHKWPILRGTPDPKANNGQLLGNNKPYGK